MTIEGEFQIWNVQATEDLTGAVIGKAIGINGTLAAGPSLAIGIARSKNVLGGPVSAVYHGITKVVVGAVVTTPGHPLKVAATSGFLVAAASGDTSCGRYLGTAACASGDLVTAMVNFMSKPAWGGN